MSYLDQRYENEVTLHWDLDDPTVLALLASHFGNASSPALDRLSELADEKHDGRAREGTSPATR